MIWRSLRTAAWLGWQIESNWTDPFLFAIYSIIKPLTSAGILVVMYAMVTKSDFASTAFSYMYLGNAFYIYVGAVMTGMSFAVIEDRERYRTLRSVYVAPIDIRMYLVGRGVARFLTGSLSVLVTVLFGVLFLHVTVHVLEVRWMLFFSTLAVGMVMLATLGLLLAGVVLVIVHQSWLIGDAVAGALYLFSGAIFPLEVLPRYLRPIGLALPITYWLELVRRALVGHVAQEFPTLSAFSDLQLLGILAVATLGLGVAAVFVFGVADHSARERGLIDRTTNY
ncbi:MAG TPA: ABC transporter permease [Vicinamibacterales bacterium]|jgi:ABC-2 type transport system permease protein|nr:ABC transporter permease [Vicinamibacterales bacterium]